MNKITAMAGKIVNHIPGKLQSVHFRMAWQMINAMRNRLIQNEARL